MRRNHLQWVLLQEVYSWPRPVVEKSPGELIGGSIIEFDVIKNHMGKGNVRQLSVAKECFYVYVDYIGVERHEFVGSTGSGYQISVRVSM
jgi:hypothetical protein